MEAETAGRERTLPCGAVVHDRRSEDDKRDTVGFVVATDRFMSGWGKASGRSIFAVPVLRGQDPNVIEDNMRHRSEMVRVRFVLAGWRPHLRNGDHLSIRAGERDGSCWTKPGHFAAEACARRNRELAGG